MLLAVSLMFKRALRDPELGESSVLQHTCTPPWGESLHCQHSPTTSCSYRYLCIYTYTYYVLHIQIGKYSNRSSAVLSCTGCFARDQHAVTEVTAIMDEQQRMQTYANAFVHCLPVAARTLNDIHAALQRIVCGYDAGARRRLVSFSAEQKKDRPSLEVERNGLISRHDFCTALNSTLPVPKSSSYY